MKAVDAILHVIRVWEGETETNDPNDPGKDTKYGISKAYHPDVDVHALTEEQAVKIYLEEYWNRINFIEAYPDRLQYMLFDIAVNIGVSTANSWRQIIAVHSPGEQESLLLKIRVMHYAHRVHDRPTDSEYIVGWLNRCFDPFPEGR